MVAVRSEPRSSGTHAHAFGGAPFAGKYAVERVLGQGGMGTVFEARHIRLGHRVAIKVLGSELRDYPELVTRFEREARAAGALSSRHAVRVFDIDVTEDATPFIVMELLTGCDLAHLIERDGPVRPSRAARWLLEACDAIAEAHALGIVHRDLKPSNLFLTADGVKVLDFGIAKRVASKEASITQAVAPLGTPQYMSPEQVRCAKDVDPRTDVWSLGVTLYELVTGETPFEHESPSACIASIAADPVPDPRERHPDLPAPFVDVILRALRKDPAERFGSVAELVSALMPFAEADEHGSPSGSARSLVACRAASRTSTASAPDVDETVPPTVSRAPLPADRRVRRSSLALAGAATLGLFALLLTPKCVVQGKGNDGKATVSALVAAQPETSIVPGAQASASPPDEPTTSVAAAHAEPPLPERPLEGVAPKGRRAATPAPSARPRASAQAVTTSVASARSGSPVHGGLSSPGF